MTEKNRELFISDLRVGNIVAFKNEEYMLSGKVLEIGEKITIQTSNNSVFYVDKKNIVWVKLGTNWPEGVYNALKYFRGKNK